MTPWVKSLLCKHTDMRSDPNMHKEFRVVVCICIRSAGGKKVEPQGSLTSQPT